MQRGSSDHWREGLETSTLAARPGLSRDSTPRVPGLTVLSHPDPRRVGWRALLAALGSGREVEISRLAPVFSSPRGGEPGPLADPHLSRNAMRLAPGPEPGSLLLRRADTPMAVEVDGSPLRDERLLDAADLERGAVLLLAARVALLLHRLPAALPREGERFGLVGDGTAMAHLRAEIRRVADLDVPVLLRGETGSGKELVAQAVHQAGARRSRPFLAVNMGAVPPTLAASELFGAAKGAFTGAEQRRIGYFRRAETGTLFLDEIGETPLEVQVLLLRALESGEIQPVGAEAPQPVDVRVIAATDADLEAAIADGRFRAPLLHRLNGYEIRVPALRERREDFGQLLHAFLRRELAALGEAHRLDDPGPRGEPWLPARLVARLAAQDWPGNVRQLRNVARQIAIGSRGAAEASLPAHLEYQLAARPRTASGKPAAAGERPAYRQPVEVTPEELLAALKANRWRLSPTAARLGISRTSLYGLIDRCPALRKAADLGREEIEEALSRRLGDLDAVVEDLQVSRHGLQMRMTELGID
jgi:two-component system, NtrC family, nitrogen regulation response regulator GlnG